MKTTTKTTKAAEVKEDLAPVEENAIDQKVVEEAAEKKPQVSDKPIPVFIRNVLQGYPMDEYLYVDSKGGVFSKGTPEHLLGDAVLYKNPYFENF